MFNMASGILAAHCASTAADFQHQRVNAFVTHVVYWEIMEYKQIIFMFVPCINNNKNTLLSNRCTNINSQIQLELN
jgi:hypothetical protein